MVDINLTGLFLTTIFLLYLGAIFVRLLLLGREKFKLIEVIALIIYFLAALFSVWLQITLQGTFIRELYEFLSVGQINFRLTFFLDDLAGLFVVFVTSLRFLIFLLPRANETGDEQQQDDLLIDLLVIGGLIFFLAGDLVLFLAGWLLTSLVFLFLGHNNSGVDLKLFLLNRLSDLLLVAGAVFLFIETGSATPILSGNTISEFSPIIPLVFGFAGLIRTGLFPFTNWFENGLKSHLSLTVFYSLILPLPTGLYLFLRYDFLFKQSFFVFSLLLFFIIITFLYAILNSIFYKKLNYILFHLSVAHISISLVFSLFGHHRAAIYYFILQTAGRLLAFAGGGILTSGSRRAGNFQGQGLIFPFAGWLVVLGLISQTGLPPLSGFWANSALIAALTNQPEGFLIFPFIYLAFILIAFSAARVASGLFMAKPETTSRVKEKKLYDPVPALAISFFVLFGGLLAYLPLFEQIIMPPTGRIGHVTIYTLLLIITVAVPAIIYKKLQSQLSPGDDFIPDRLPFKIKTKSLSTVLTRLFDLVLEKSSGFVSFFEKNVLTPLWLLPNFIIKLSEILIRFLHTGKTVHYLNYTLVTIIVVFLVLYFIR